MKRWLCLLLLAAMLLTGCVHVPPPFAFYVESEEMLEELRAATLLTDGEFEAWRKAAQTTKEVSGSPITRELAVEALALLDSVGYPVPKEDGSADLHISFRPYDEYISVIYTMEGVRYRFIISPFQRKTLRLWFPTMRCELDGTELLLYRGRQKTLTGELYTGAYRIRVTVMNYSGREAVDFSAFTWQGGQWK